MSEQTAITKEKGMTDYQFKHMLALTEERDALARELERLRGEQGSEPMTDFEFKKIIEMFYQIVKANHEAGKSVEEILAIIVALRNGDITPPAAP